MKLLRNLKQGKSVHDKEMTLAEEVKKLVNDIKVSEKNCLKKKLLNFRKSLGIKTLMKLVLNRVR